MSRPIPISDANAMMLSQRHKEVGKLSCSTCTFGVTAGFIIGIALIVIAASCLYARHMGTSPSFITIVPPILGIVLTIPLIIAAVKQSKEVKNRKDRIKAKLIEILTPLEQQVVQKGHTKEELLEFIKEKVLKDSFDKHEVWDRSYKEHLIGELQKAFPKDSHPNLSKALTNAQTGLYAALKKQEKQ